MLVLDTCAFFTQNHPDGSLVTVPEIEKEIVNKQSKQYFDNLLSINLKLIEPKTESCTIVKAEARKTGDYDVLSKIDLKIIALAYECKGTIITDDFAIQNVALALDMDFSSCSGNSITEKRKWKYKCSACNHIETQKLKKCAVCGSEDIFRIKAK